MVGKTGPVRQQKKLSLLERIWALLVIKFFRRYYEGPMGVYDPKNNYIYKIYRERKR